MNSLNGTVMTTIMAPPNPKPDIPGPLQGKTQDLMNWIAGLLGWGAAIAFLVVGGVFCYAFFGGHGSSKAIRALAGVSVGCILISAGSALSRLLL